MSSRAGVSVLLVCAALVLPRAALLGEDMSAAADLLKAAKTVRIQVSQTYVDGEETLKGIALPAAATAARIFGYAGLKSVSTSGKETLPVSITISGEAESANYMPGGTMSTGASITGTIAIGTGEKAVELEFEGEEPCPQVVTLGAANLLPFGTAFEQSTFASALLQAVSEGFGSRPVVKAFADPAVLVRRTAIEQAVKSADPPAAGAVVPMLKDKDPTVRVAAAEALGRLGSADAIAPLVTALTAAANRGWPEVRTAAIRALGGIADAKATPALVSALSDPDANARKAAAESLLKMGWRASTDKEQIALAVAQADFATAAAFGKAAIPRLAAAMTDFDSDIQSGAVNALAGMDDPAGLDAVISLARDKTQPDLTARTAAVIAIGKSSDPRATKSLLALLKDADYTIVSQAADSLAEKGEKSAVPSLLALLKSKEDLVREAAGRALNTLEWAPSTDQEALAYYPAVQDWDSCVELGDKAVPALVDTVQNSGYWFDAIESLGRIGTRSAVAALARILKDDNPAFREQAATALGRTSSAAARDPLKRALKDDSESVRDAAREALQELESAD